MKTSEKFARKCILHHTKNHWKINKRENLQKYFNKYEKMPKIIKKETPKIIIYIMRKILEKILPPKKINETEKI